MIKMHRIKVPWTLTLYNLSSNSDLTCSRSLHCVCSICRGFRRLEDRNRRKHWETDCSVQIKELIYLSWNSRLNGKICPLLNTKKESRKKYILYGYSKRNCLCNREKEGRMEGRWRLRWQLQCFALQCSYCFCLFFLFFVSQTRSVLPGMNC